ncbi:hypothetical protein MK139_09740, partial [bacterium]|nr:hypothetical protein [bacterium]
MPDHIRQLKVGALDVHIISEGVINVHTSQAFEGKDESLWRPHVETDADDRMDYGLNIVHVKTDTASVLIDTSSAASEIVFAFAIVLHKSVIADRRDRRREVALMPRWPA